MQQLIIIMRLLISMKLVLYYMVLKLNLLELGKVNMKDSYASVDKNGEVFVYSMHISPYDYGNIFNKDPLRVRKLLLNKSEIHKLVGMVNLKGLTLVPIDLYFNKNFVKMTLGVGRGKKLFDKREVIKKRDIERKLKEYK